MSLLVRTTAIAGLALGVGVVAAPAASADTRHHARDVVFVQTDALTGNSVVAFDRGRNGQLHQAGVYPTGGLGGALTGAVVDHTASEGALTADRDNRELYAVNAGSDTLSVFDVRGTGCSCARSSTAAAASRSASPSTTTSSTCSTAATAAASRASGTSAER